MSKFKVGDVIKGKKDNSYLHANEDMRKAKVLELDEDDMLIKILEHNKKRFIGDEYFVINSESYFELVETKFYKTLPNDFSGKLTIEKGQVVEKEEKGNILDEVEKEYLRAVIKPFRKRIKNIVKYVVHSDRGHYDFIDIYLISGEEITFPYFEQYTMYKGMISGKEYTLEELGL